MAIQQIEFFRKPHRRSVYGVFEVEEQYGYRDQVYVMPTTTGIIERQLTRKMIIHEASLELMKHNLIKMVKVGEIQKSAATADVAARICLKLRDICIAHPTVHPNTYRK